MISSQILFLFSALGSVNGVFLACYLFSRKSQRLANGLLGALLLAICVRTVKSTFYYFNPELAVGFLQVGMSACLFIGPLTYLYVRYALADLAQGAAGQHWRWHILLAVLAVGIGVLFPYAEHPQVWRRVMGGIHIYWAFYLVLAARELLRARIASRQAILIYSVFFSSSLILIAYASTRYTSYIVGALSFTFSIHLTVLMYFMQPDKKGEIPKPENGDDDARAILSSLNEVMREQQLYLNPNLTLSLLAKKVGNLQTTVSQVINDNLGKSFNLYINEYRIQYAKDLLVRESHLNMELVAERSGFNSNSTFFAAFKKITGQTPASYRAEYSS